MYAVAAVAAFAVLAGLPSPASASALQAAAVSWGPVDGAAFYEVQVRPHGATWSQSITVSTPQPAWVPTNLPFSGRVDWRERPVFSNGSKGNWSAGGTLRLDRATPPKPKNLRASRQGSRVTLAWRVPEAAQYAVTGSHIYWSTNGSHWRPLSKVTGYRAVVKVNRAKSYWFMVSAENAAGEGSPRRIHVKS